VLEGSIQREDNRIRVTAQLINTADDAHLWSQTYNRELESVFDIQDDISRAIVSAMRIELLGPGEAVISRRYTENIEAYNYYTRGRHLWNRQTEEDVRKAIGHFEKAIELDSNYALAYSGLADSWSSFSRHAAADGAVSTTEALDHARAAAETAVGLDESLAEAHASLGMALWDVKDMEGAEARFLRAIELNPGYAWARFSYSGLLRALARYQDAIREENTAFELDPMSIPLIINRAQREEQSFNWQGAEELYKRLIEIEPNRRQSYVDYAWFLVRRGDRHEDALRQCSLATQIDKRAYNELAYIYERTGDVDRALWAAQMAIESAPEKHNAYDTRGGIYALGGMLDSAVTSFKRALEIEPSFVPSLWQLGNVLMFRQEYAAADSLFGLIASNPDKFVRASGRVFLTQIPLHQGRFEKGLRMLDDLRGAALDEDVLGSQLAYGNLKRAYINQIILNDQRYAISEYERVKEHMREIDKNSWMVAFARGGIAYSHAINGEMKRADQLMAELKNDIDSYGPSPVNVYPFFTAQLELAKGNYDTAVASFQEAYKLSPLWVMRSLLAQCYLAVGRIDEAVETYEKIIYRYDLNRAYWPSLGVVAHYYLGQAYEEAGRDEEAIVQYETFLDIWKNADEGLTQVEDAMKRVAKLKHALRNRSYGWSKRSDPGHRSLY
jgi:tetratricopeptide (TPR) repeat protein